MKTILNQLDERDEFNIIMFSDEMEYWKPEFVASDKENVNASIEYINNKYAAGGNEYQIEHLRKWGKLCW